MASRDAGPGGGAEELGGTASTVRRWALVEQPGPWGSEALTQSNMPAATVALLQDVKNRPGTKALLIRRREGADPHQRLVVAAASEVGAERLASKTVATLDDVAGLTELADLDAWLDHPVEVPADRLLIAVCTNGKHDPCCATFGRPLVRAFRDDPSADVWECSHIGGDRFAANVLVLPHGLYFGRVLPEEAGAFHAQLLAGRIPLGTYRGRSSLSRPAQWAEVVARRESGEDRIDALTGWEQERVGDGRWQVTLQLGGRTHEVGVEQGEAEEARFLTCNASRMSTPRPMRATAVTIGS